MVFYYYKIIKRRSYKFDNLQKNVTGLSFDQIKK